MPFLPTAKGPRRLCQKCGLQEATVHLRTRVYRQTIEQHLCALCAGTGEGYTEPLANRRFVADSRSSGEANKRPKRVELPPKISVRDLAQTLRLSPDVLIAHLMEQGVFATLSHEMDFEVAAKICAKYGVVASPEEGA